MSTKTIVNRVCLWHSHVELSGRRSVCQRATAFPTGHFKLAAVYPSHFLQQYLANATDIRAHCDILDGPVIETKGFVGRGGPVVMLREHEPDRICVGGLDASLDAAAGGDADSGF